MVKDNDKTVERLLQRPYWVIDMLPKQVPQDNKGQFFVVERYYLEEPRHKRVCRQFAAVLLKLNCYYDLTFSHDAEHWQLNPEPEKIVLMVNACLSKNPTEECLFVSLAKDEMLLTLQRDTTHTTIYNPTQEFLHLLRQLALAEGLFVWKPKQS